MVIHNLKNGKYSIKIKGLDEKIITSSWADAMKIVKIKGLDEKIITSSWADAMKIAWKLGGNK